jgi:hypothetical protein
MKNLNCLLCATSILLVVAAGFLSMHGLSINITNAGSSSQWNLEHIHSEESYVPFELYRIGKAESTIPIKDIVVIEHRSVGTTGANSQYDLGGPWKVNITTDKGSVAGYVNIRQNASGIYVYANDPNNARCGDYSTDPSIWGTVRGNSIKGHAHICTVTVDLRSQESTQVVDERPASVEISENRDKMKMNLTLGSGQFLSIIFAR